jgi:Ca2+-binding EF-hand superfamily protein
MRKIWLVAAGAAVLAAGACGFAQAQDGSQERGGRHGIFQSDSNSDGVLTRAEFDAGHTTSFARLDSDNNGQLTREEMRAERGEHRGRRGGHRGGGTHQLASADANNDGNITREEFLARPNQMFERLDDNSDGVISANERPQRGERGERGGEQRAERPDRPHFDSDNNGTLSRAEFTAMGAGMFERLDANDDGRVTQEEARAGRRHRGGDRD